MVRFKHPAVSPPELVLRLNPTSVKWTYNLVTNTEDTYGGQVIQMLGINIGQLTIEGKFGREGPHGRKAAGRGLTIPKDPSEFWTVDNSYKYGNGMSQMWAWFADYFQIATQEAFDQTPVTLTYGGGGWPYLWKVYPISHPSFARDNKEEAPVWQVVCEVEDPDPGITQELMNDAIFRIRENTGTIDPKYSMPFVEESASTVEDLIEIADQFRELLPAYSQEELEQLIMFNAAVPWYLTGDQKVSPNPSDNTGTMSDPGIPGNSQAGGAILPAAGSGAQAMLNAIKLAKKFNLEVRENPVLDPVDGDHVTGSFHYQVFPGTEVGRAIDVYGTAENMLAFTKAMYTNRESLAVQELFYDPWGSYDPQSRGSGSGAYSTQGIGGHSNHVHVSI